MCGCNLFFSIAKTRRELYFAMSLTSSRRLIIIFNFDSDFFSFFLIVARLSSRNVVASARRASIGDRVFRMNRLSSVQNRGIFLSHFESSFLVFSDTGSSLS